MTLAQVTHGNVQKTVMGVEAFKEGTQILSFV